MASYEDGAAWIALRLVRGVGNVAYRTLLGRFGGPAAVLRASADELTACGVRAEVARAIARFDQWRLADEQMRRLRRCGGSLVTWNDETYPRNLREIHDPPPFLFVAGELRPEDRIAIAVVGTRSPSTYGREMTRSLCGRLARLGAVIVSGLARGIDAEAHRAALRARGRTLAVLGSGIDVVYPAEHHAMFQAITRTGAVVSEFLMGTTPEAENFPSRNRIISGVALGTVVVEAADRSGSLITAQLAAEQGREVFAVPGPVGPRSRGSHRLLREGAKLTENAEDVLEEIAPQLLERADLEAETGDGDADRDTPLERAIRGFLTDEPLHVDQVASRAGAEARHVLEALLCLELRGAARQLPGKYFVAASEPARSTGG